MKNFNESLGGKISKLRYMRSITQADLGKAVGVTFQQIQKYENGKNRISAEMLNKIATYFNTSPLVFFSEFTNETRWPTNREECKLLGMFRSVKSEYHRGKIFRMVELLKGFDNG